MRGFKSGKRDRTWVCHYKNSFSITRGGTRIDQVGLISKLTASALDRLPSATHPTLCDQLRALDPDSIPGMEDLLCGHKSFSHPGWASVFPSPLLAFPSLLMG